MSTRGLRLWFVRMNAITHAFATSSGTTNTNRNGTEADERRDDRPHADRERRLGDRAPVLRAPTGSPSCAR